MQEQRLTDSESTIMRSLPYIDSFCDDRVSLNQISAEDEDMKKQESLSDSLKKLNNLRGLIWQTDDTVYLFRDISREIGDPLQLTHDLCQHSWNDIERWTHTLNTQAIRVTRIKLAGWSYRLSLLDNPAQLRRRIQRGDPCLLYTSPSPRD